MRTRARLAGLMLSACLALVALGAGAAVPDADALRTMARALEASPRDDALRARYGDALFRAGEALASLRVLNPGREPTARWVPELREAADVYQGLGQYDAARRALRDAIALDSDDASLYQTLASVYAAARRAGVALEGDPIAASSGAGAPSPDGEAASEPRRTADATAPAEAALRLEAPPRSQLVRLAALALLALALVGLALAWRAVRRGRGDLVVSIELPTNASGAFHVRLSRQRERMRPRPAREGPQTRASTRFEHFLVARETHFRALPARSYWVTLDGRVENGAGGDEDVREERELRVERERTTRIVFDLRPRLAPVELRIVRGGADVGDARVALGGDPTSLRRARLGRTRLSLGPGAHRILVAADGAAAEHVLLVDGVDPRSLTIDLADAESCAFTDCDAAVEPFLRGDLSVAAAALERGGQRDRADLLLARFHQSQGAADNAADRFEAAGRWIEAAELRAERGEHGHAAALFEKAGEPARAAECYEADGDLLRAGRAFEQAGELDSALRCYRAAGNAPRLIDVLEKQGDVFEAGRTALEQGDTARALRDLQQVDARSPHYAEACRLAAETLCREGKPELALRKAEEAMTFGGPEASAPERQLWFAELLARAGRPERALRALEELHERAPRLEGVATRIDELRKEVSRARRQGERTEPALAFDESSRYELFEQIGNGGMGVVYRARDRRLGRDVALKRMPESLRENPRAVELFLREARAAAALNHPNIVTVYDVDVDGGVYFLTMELLSGSTLADVVRARGRLLAYDAMRLGLQVCAGLAYAHAHQIVHRDIKSSNLFLTSERVVKVMDFGLAKMLAEVRRGTTVVGGTPYYMAPEQALGEAVDARADLYALGVTLFEWVTGRRPFEEGDVIWHHRMTPAPDPRAAGADIPEPLAALILALLAKDPDARPPSADAVARQLHALATSARRS